MLKSSFELNSSTKRMKSKQGKINRVYGSSFSIKMIPDNEELIPLLLRESKLFIPSTDGIDTLST